MKINNDNQILLLALLALLPLHLLSIQNARACDDTQSELVMHIIADNYPQENSWEVYNENEELIFSNFFDEQVEVYDTVCISNAACTIFTMIDSYGDGMCCSFGEGSYTLYVDGEMIASGSEFNSASLVPMNCPPGESCLSAYPVEEFGNLTTPTDLNDTWYVFTADTTGQYLFSTCDLGNGCETALWIYDYCQDLDWDDSPEGAIYFAQKGCDEGIASLNPILQDGQTYYLRVGDVAGNCEGTAINFTFDFIGAIIGCMDQAACTYNPLATISDTTDCVYYPDPACPDGLPDLMVLSDVVANTLQVSLRDNEDGCAIEEGCLAGYGAREILEFATHIENIGDADYYIGQTPANVEDDPLEHQWEWDPCHGHWHYEGYAEYLLYDEQGQALPVGFKNGFCVMDLDCSMQGGDAKFGCGIQGISAQCGDIYWVGLDCQWIDITDVAEGNYTLVVRVNWDKSPDLLGRPESNYANNWAQVCINLTRDDFGAAAVNVVEACNPYYDCAGEIYGAAQLDCTGECAGTVLTGDLNADGLQDLSDMSLYISSILDNTTEVSTCSDLNADEQISITDAALMLACHHQNTEIPDSVEVVNDYCTYPISITNPNDHVHFQIGQVDLDNQTIEIDFLHPYNHIAAYQFQISGLDISIVETILEQEDLLMQTEFNETGTIIGIAMNYVPIMKNEDYTPNLRIHYDAFTANEVCIESITAVVNSDYEETVTYISGNCLQLTGLDKVNINLLKVKAFPNPFKDATHIQFANPNNHPFNLSISDISGKMIYQKNKLRGNYIKLSKKDAALSTGIYLYQLTSNGITYTGKLVVQ